MSLPQGPKFLAINSEKENSDDKERKKVEISHEEDRCSVQDSERQGAWSEQKYISMNKQECNS